jgi:hypothetical protein
MAYIGGPPFEITSELYEAEARRVLILRREDGFYCFVEQSFQPPEPEDEVYLGQWVTKMQSGLYATADAAERDAQLHRPWLLDPKTS